MASIKIQAKVIILACRYYEKNYNDWLNSYEEDKNDDCGWMETRVKKENLSKVLWIKEMAETVYDTSYPYVTINISDFHLISKYLN